MPTLFEKVSDDNNVVLPLAVANVFHVSINEIADVTGIPKDDLTCSDRMRISKTQVRLISMLEIIDMVSGWAGSRSRAYAWYRTEPIPACEHLTPESAVKLGHAEAVKDYIKGIALGGYA